MKQINLKKNVFLTRQMSSSQEMRSQTLFRSDPETEALGADRWLTEPASGQSRHDGILMGSSVLAGSPSFFPCTYFLHWENGHLAGMSHESLTKSTRTHFEKA